MLLKPLQLTPILCYKAPTGFAEDPDFQAVFAFGDSLFVGGNDVLYECDRTGAKFHPSLRNCENKLEVRQTILSISGTSRTDLFAVGVDNGNATPLFYKRVALNTWQNVDGPTLVGALRGVWRIPWLLVVVGDNGGVYSKVVH